MSPIRGWRKPIYALPGNHDWYDELEGFMFHFCGVEPPPAGFGDNPSRPFLWRPPRRGDGVPKSSAMLDQDERRIPACPVLS